MLMKMLALYLLLLLVVDTLSNMSTIVLLSDVEGRKSRTVRDRIIRIVLFFQLPAILFTLYYFLY